jgi:hypothetical protein
MFVCTSFVGHSLSDGMSMITKPTYFKRARQQATISRGRLCSQKPHVWGACGSLCILKVHAQVLQQSAYLHLSILMETTRADFSGDDQKCSPNAAPDPPVSPVVAPHAANEKQILPIPPSAAATSRK